MCNVVIVAIVVIPAQKHSKFKDTLGVITSTIGRFNLNASSSSLAIVTPNKSLHSPWMVLWGQVSKDPSQEKILSLPNSDTMMTGFLAPTSLTG